MLSGSKDAKKAKQTDEKREYDRKKQQVVRANRKLTIELGELIKENCNPEHLSTQEDQLIAEADLWDRKTMFLNQVLERAKFKTSSRGALVSTLDSSTPSEAVLQTEVPEPCSSSSNTPRARKK